MVPHASGSGSTAGGTAGGTGRRKMITEHPYGTRAVPVRYYRWIPLFLNEGSQRYYRQYNGCTARPGSYGTSCGTAAAGVWRALGTVDALQR